jgi:hypothetical protein
LRVRLEQSRTVAIQKPPVADREIRDVPMYFAPGSGAVESRPNRSATGVAEGSGTVVRTFLGRRIPVIENFRITLATFVSFTTIPASGSSAVTRGERWAPSASR